GVFRWQGQLEFCWQRFVPNRMPNWLFVAAASALANFPAI
ncbi:MAG: hypothetical protein ACI87E_004681, partial [Mariniblastus sp.]